MPLRDLVFAARTLRKNLIFALTAILTIVLGVGASATIFSVANAVLLRPLPLKDPNRLVIFRLVGAKIAFGRDFTDADGNCIL